MWYYKVMITWNKANVIKGKKNIEVYSMKTIEDYLISGLEKCVRCNEASVF